MGILYADTCLRYIKSVAGRNGVFIQWEDKTHPRTDGRVVYLPRISSGMTEEQLDKLRLFVKHETCHVKWSSFDVLKKHRPTGLLMFIANLLEDHRIDYLNDSVYAGDRTLTANYMRKWSENAVADNPYLTLFAWDAGVRADLYPELSFDGVDEVLRNKLSKYDEDVRKARIIEEPEAGTLATYMLAKRILEEVFGEDVSAMESGEDGEGEGENAEGSHSSDEGGEEAGEREGEGTEAETDGEEEGTRRGKKSAGKYTPMYEPHDGRASLKGKFSGEGYKPSEEVLVLAADSDSWLLTKDKSRFVPKVSSLVQRSNLHNILRQKLQVVSKARTVYGQKRGKLNGSSLFKVGIDSPSKDRIFTRKVQSETLNAAVTLLVDCSGSMVTLNKYVHACAAALMLKDTFSILGVPLEILGFTEYGDGEHIIYEFQKFGDNVPKNKMMEFMSKCYLLDNVDGESIVFAHNRLLQRREKRRILVVLSDGMPCGGHCKGNIDIYTREVIDEIEAKSPIELVGIGVLFKGVADMYKKHAIINDASAIESTLISLVDKYVFN